MIYPEWLQDKGIYPTWLLDVAIIIALLAFTEYDVVMHFKEEKRTIYLKGL